MRQLLVFRILVMLGAIAVASPIIADDEEGEAASTDDVGHADTDEGAEDHADGEEAGHEHESHIGHEGVDTNPLSFKTDLAIFTLIVFLLLFFGLKQFAWPQIMIALDQREANLERVAADAESARAQAMALLREHQGRMEAIQDDVKEIIAEARRDAERTKADIVAAAARESEVLKERALLEISRAKDQALNELFQQMAQQVAGATQHVLGKGLTLADQQKLIDEALREFASQSA